MSLYKNALKEMVINSDMDQDSWASDEWKAVAELVTEQDLVEAYEKTKLVAKRLDRLGALWPRRQKTLERVREKIAEHRGLLSTRVSERWINYFKSVSDLIGFRVNCELQQIEAKLAFLLTLEDCVCHVRQPSYESNGKYRDITQYVYVYFPDIGHIVELQIGHPFAAYTFTIDSLIRDRLTGIKKAMEQGIILDVKPAPVDLWDKNFYSNVKDYILGRANGTISDVESVDARENLQVQMRVLFGERPIPEKLTSLLEDLL